MNLIRLTLLIIALSLLVSKSALAQSQNVQRERPTQSTSAQTAVTKDGRIVILKSDGTWEYEKEVRDSNTSSAIGKESAEKATIIEVETDQISYVGKPVVINGILMVRSDYVGGYRNAQHTHYAFMLRDEKLSFNAAYVYMQRGDTADNLRKRLLANKGELEGTFTIKIIPGRFDKNISTLAAELIDYKLVDENNGALSSPMSAAPSQGTTDDPAPLRATNNGVICLSWSTTFHRYLLNRRSTPYARH